MPPDTASAHAGAEYLDQYDEPCWWSPVRCPQCGRFCGECFGRHWCVRCRFSFRAMDVGLLEDLERLLERHDDYRDRRRERHKNWRYL